MAASAAEPTVEVPATWRLAVRDDTIVTGCVLVGGDPIIVVALSDAAVPCVQDFRDGRTVGEVVAAHGPVAGDVARRLLDIGAAFPRPCPAAGPGLGEVAVVVPAHNAETTLPELVGALPAGLAEIIVVDDGSSDATAEVARALGAQVIVHPRPRGPSAARNAGWRSARAPFVLMVDADTQLDEGGLALLVAHMADPAVAVVAPRIVALEDSEAVAPSGLIHRWVAAHETARSPFDLGPDPARAEPGGRVAFLPSGALLARRRALEAAGGFDEAMPLGEDVDLSWRLLAGGWTLRYEPAAVIRHRHRVDPGDMLRRRFLYGTASGPISQRHPQATAALTVDVGPLAALAAGVVVGPVAGASLASLSIAAAVARLRARGVSASLAGRLVARDHVRQFRAALFGVTRPWLPAAVVAAVVSRGARRLLGLALLSRHTLEWRRLRPAMSLPAWVALRTVDDATFAAGVWRGALAQRTAAPLSVRLRGRPPSAGANPSPGWTELSRFG